MPPTVPAAAAAVSVCSLAGMALLWRDISSKMKGDNRTFGSLLSQYVAVKVVGWLGDRQRRKLEADTLNVRQVQQETLLRRLRKNANTLYGRRYDFGSIKGETTITHFSESDPQLVAATVAHTCVVTTARTRTRPQCCCDVTVTDILIFHRVSCTILLNLLDFLSKYPHLILSKSFLSSRVCFCCIN